MKIFIMKLLFSLLFLLFLIGCTITKRHFGPGYHVEWKKSFFKEEKETDMLNVIGTKSELSAAPNNYEAIPENILVDSIRSSEIPVDTIEKETSVPETQTNLKSHIDRYKDDILDDEIPIEPEERKVEPFTWAALGCLILGGIMALLSLVVSIPEITMVFTLACVVTFIIFSMVSVVHIHRNPGAYKAKGLSWALFGLSTAVIGLVLYGMVQSTLTQFF